MWPIFSVIILTTLSTALTVAHALTASPYIVAIDSIGIIIILFTFILSLPTALAAYAKCEIVTLVSPTKACLLAIASTTTAGVMESDITVATATIVNIALIYSHVRLIRDFKSRRVIIDMV
jgi:hypothetical protein